MNQLSDLELVAQAMSYSDSTSKPKPEPNPQTNGDSSPKPKDLPQPQPNTIQPTPPTQNQTNAPQPTLGRDLPDLTPLNASIDPSTLTSLTSLMSLSDSELESLDEGQIEEIMRQLEVADDVADDLEGKLDRLLATLGGVEEEIVHDQDLEGLVDGKQGEERVEEKK